MNVEVWTGGMLCGVKKRGHIGINLRDNTINRAFLTALSHQIISLRCATQIVVGIKEDTSGRQAHFPPRAALSSSPKCE